MVTDNGEWKALFGPLAASVSAERLFGPCFGLVERQLASMYQEDNHAAGKVAAEFSDLGKLRTNLGDFFEEHFEGLPVLLRHGRRAVKLGILLHEGSEKVVPLFVPLQQSRTGLGNFLAKGFKLMTLFVYDRQSL
jgi:hypothetical protein